MRMALGMVVAAAACIAHAEELVTLHFYVRPPYMDQTEGARVRGLTADPAQAAFEKAGIPFRWQQTPTKRQLVLIESGTGLDCGVGWYKTPSASSLENSPRRCTATSPRLPLRTWAFNRAVST